MSVSYGLGIDADRLRLRPGTQTLKYAPFAAKTQVPRPADATRHTPEKSEASPGAAFVGRRAYAGRALLGGGEACGGSAQHATGAPQGCAWRVGAREHEKATLHETLLNINAPYSSCLAL